MWPFHVELHPAYLDEMNSYIVKNGGKKDINILDTSRGMEKFAITGHCKVSLLDDIQKSLYRTAGETEREWLWLWQSPWNRTFEKRQTVLVGVDQISGITERRMTVLPVRNSRNVAFSSWNSIAVIALCLPYSFAQLQWLVMNVAFLDWFRGFPITERKKFLSLRTFSESQVAWVTERWMDGWMDWQIDGAQIDIIWIIAVKASDFC